MLNQSKMNDRRMDNRFKAADNAFVVLHSDSIIVTSLVDITMDGLAFEYMIDSEDYLGNAKDLDIFCADDDFYDFHLQNVPFEIISRKSDHHNSLIKKRYGVKFGKLTPAQKTQLEYFIRHHAKNEDRATDPSSENHIKKGLFNRISFVF